jgi:hypothetical protein
MVAVPQLGRPVRLEQSPNSYRGRIIASPHQQGRARFENLDTRMD